MASTPRPSTDRPRPRVGLCSVTFRALTPEKVVEAAAAAGLESIEWGSDVHVPAPDTRRARRVGTLTRRAGLAVASYGSYLGFPWARGKAEEIRDVVAGAVALEAPRIRAWAGPVGSGDATSEQRAGIVAAGRTLVDAATAEGVGVSFEFHDGTLTDTAASALRFLDELDRPGAGTYWQPRVGAPDEEALADLDALAGRVTAVHAFSWTADYARHRLGTRRRFWEAVARRAVARPAVTDLLIEFLPGDDPELLGPEAADLIGWRDAALRDGA